MTFPRHFINAFQSKEVRIWKYKNALANGFDWNVAMRIRDWPMPSVLSFIFNVDVKNYSGIKKEK